MVIWTVKLMQLIWITINLVLLVSYQMDSLSNSVMNRLDFIILNMIKLVCVFSDVHLYIYVYTCTMWGLFNVSFLWPFAGCNVYIHVVVFIIVQWIVVELCHTSKRHQHLFKRSNVDETFLVSNRYSSKQASYLCWNFVILLASA